MADAPIVLSPAHPAPGENWFTDDPALKAHLQARLPEDAWSAIEKRLTALGTVAPRDVDPLARDADRYPPELHRFDATGERVDDVRYHPSYHELARLAREHQVFNHAYHGGARVAGFALGYLYAQAECGYYCPACMTDGAAFVLSRAAPAAVAEAFVPRLVQAHAEGAYEGGMFLTEKAGGSDVGATRTTATAADDGSWRLTGDKWFCSNVTADAVLTLARMPNGAEGTAGLGLFLLPRRLPDGSRNVGFQIERLKDKLGVTSMATGEVTLDGAFAHLVADAGSGMRTMLDMVNLSRLYNAVASIAIARRSVREGVRNGMARQAFGKRLLDHPLYARSVMDHAVAVEGALAFVLETAVTFDRAAAGDRDAARLMRALTPLAKALTAKLAVATASEACEWLGGNGYIEDFVTPRLLRDAQVLPIWEGTTNVQALDFLRAAGPNGGVVALLADVEERFGRVHDARIGSALDALNEDVAALPDSPGAEREALALPLMTRAYHLMAGTLLAEAAARDGGRAEAVADVYIARHVHPRGDAGERTLASRLTDAPTVLNVPSREKH